MKRYTKTHEWIVEEQEGGPYLVGITQTALDMLGDVVFFDPSVEVDEVVSATQDVLVVESVKAASDIYAPVDGAVREFNQAVIDDPGSVTSNTWLFKFEVVDPFALELLSEQEIKE